MHFWGHLQLFLSPVHLPIEGKNVSVFAGNNSEYLWIIVSSTDSNIPNTSFSPFNSVHRGDIMMHVGEHVGKNLSISIENPDVLNIPHVLNISRCTHDIPPMYS